MILAFHASSTGGSVYIDITYEAGHKPTIIGITFYWLNAT